MKKIKNYIILLVVLVAFSSCEDYFEPNYSNDLSEGQVFDYNTNPEYLAGLYVPAYRAIPSSYTTYVSNFMDCATDNAVTNNNNSYAWITYTVPGVITSNNYPINSWDNNYENINNCYNFLTVGLEEDILYRTSKQERSDQLKERMKGEVHFLLALNYFQLLRDYAGPVNGEIMGVPLVKGLISVEEAKSLRRDTYDDCVQFVSDMIDTALVSGLLPEYTTGYVESNPELGLEPTIYGDNALGLPTTVACNMLKSRLYLYAASPAMSVGKSSGEINALYTKAAQAAKAAIDVIGGLDASMYDPANVDDNYFTRVDFNPELILRRATRTSTWEFTNYPPSLGLTVQGRTNPSQNLVDAFPMANGYPINDAMSGYDSTDPYTQRDPRFYMTVIHNNATFKNTQIQVYNGGNTAIGAPGISDDSRISRTNYYLRKFITEVPTFVEGQQSDNPWHFVALFRAVEAYLNYAEAVNAGGNEVDGLSAKQALRVVRHRANIPNGAGSAVSDDPYLNGLSDLTALVKTERRIELCFENHRYYDVRRWNDDLNVIVKGAGVTTEDGGATIEYDLDVNVYPNQATFPEFMRYGAIPRGEILSCPNLNQNDGWN